MATEIKLCNTFIDANASKSIQEKFDILSTAASITRIAADRTGHFCEILYKFEDESELRYQYHSNSTSWSAF